MATKKQLRGPALIRAVASFIEKEPHRYNQEHYMSDESCNGNICNTTCCIAGTACLLSGRKITPLGDYSSSFTVDGTYGFGEAARKDTDLSPFIANSIFDEGFKMRKNKYRNIKAVANLLRFLATKPLDEEFLLYIVKDRNLDQDVKDMVISNYKDCA